MKSQTDRFLAENIKDNIIENLPPTAEEIVKEIKKDKPIRISILGKERLGKSSTGIKINKLYNKLRRKRRWMKYWRFF